MHCRLNREDGKVYDMKKQNRTRRNAAVKMLQDGFAGVHAQRLHAIIRAARSLSGSQWLCYSLNEAQPKRMIVL